MGLREKFRRTPKFVVWPGAVLLGWSLGLAAAWGVLELIDRLPSRPHALEWSFSWGVLIGLTLLCSVTGIIGMISTTLILRRHHAVSRKEVVFTIPAWLFLPILCTLPRLAEAYDRRLALVGWSVFSPCLIASYLLCTRVIVHRDTQAKSELAGALDARAGR